MKIRAASRWLAIGLCLVGCGVARTSVRDPALAERARTAEQWFDAARQGFDPARPADAMTRELLTALDGATVVGIGEASHGTHEDAAFKTALALALVDAGRIDTLYLEANHAGAAELDAYLHAGSGDARAAVRDAAIFRVLKTEALAELVAGLKERVGRGLPVHIVGIDCQDSARDAEQALRHVARRDAQQAARLRAALEPLVGEAPSRLRHSDLMKTLTVAVVDGCIAQLEVLEAACQDDREALLAARRARQGLVAFRLDASDGDETAGDRSYFSLRDRYMAENILADGRRGVFWGHNIHVAASPPRGQMEGYEPTGAFLRRELEWRYRSVLFDYRHARILGVIHEGDEEWPSATAPREVVLRGPLDGGLAAALGGAACSSYWIDMARLPRGMSAWRDSERQVDWPGYFLTRERVPEWVVSLPFDEIADVMVVFDSLSAAKPLP
jgi:erythromycin esterase